MRNPIAASPIPIKPHAIRCVPRLLELSYNKYDPPPKLAPVDTILQPKQSSCFGVFGSGCIKKWKVCRLTLSKESILFIILKVHPIHLSVIHWEAYCRKLDILKFLIIWFLILIEVFSRGLQVNQPYSVHLKLCWEMLYSTIEKLIFRVQFILQINQLSRSIHPLQAQEYLEFTQLVILQQF